VARPLYSQGFIYYTEDTPNREFEVPAGFLIVVRQVICYSYVGGTEMSVVATQAGADAGIVFAALEALGVNVSDNWEGRVVVNAGGTLYLNLSAIAAGDTAYVGGYLLAE
jgi:hypothetical protein